MDCNVLLSDIFNCFYDYHDKQNQHLRILTTSTTKTKNRETFDYKTKSVQSDYKTDVI